MVAVKWPQERQVVCYHYQAGVAELVEQKGNLPGDSPRDGRSRVAGYQVPWTGLCCCLFWLEMLKEEQMTEWKQQQQPAAVVR